jgi:hypothetical protein
MKGNYDLLGCDIMHFVKSAPTLRGNVLPQRRGKMEAVGSSETLVSIYETYQKTVMLILL